jgi:hypothetical protein
MVFGHFYSFIYGLRRYVIGLQDSSNWRDMLVAPQWQPPFGWMALAALYLVVLVAGAVLLHRWVTVGHTTTPAAPELIDTAAEDTAAARLVETAPRATAKLES